MQYLKSGLVFIFLLKKLKLAAGHFGISGAGNHHIIFFMWPY